MNKLSKFFLFIVFALLGGVLGYLNFPLLLYISFHSISIFFFISLFSRQKKVELKDEKIEQWGSFYRDLFKDYLEPKDLNINEENTHSIPKRESRIKKKILVSNYFQFFKYMTPRRLQFMIIVAIFSGIVKGFYDFSNISKENYLYQFKTLVNIIFFYSTVFGLVYTIFRLNTLILDSAPLNRLVS